MAGHQHRGHCPASVGVREGGRCGSPRGCGAKAVQESHNHHHRRSHGDQKGGVRRHASHHHASHCQAGRLAGASYRRHCLRSGACQGAGQRAYLSHARRRSRRSFACPCSSAPSLHELSSRMFAPVIIVIVVIGATPRSGAAPHHKTSSAASCADTRAKCRS